MHEEQTQEETEETCGRGFRRGQETRAEQGSGDPGRTRSAVFLQETELVFENCDCRPQGKTDISSVITIHVLHRYWSTQAGLFPAAICGRGPAFFLIRSRSRETSV